MKPLAYLGPLFAERYRANPRWSRQPLPGSVVLFALLLGMIVPRLSFARDLQGRLGLGYNNEWINSAMPNGVPGVSIKYGLTRDIGAEAIVCISTATPSNSCTAIKFSKNLFFETNMNFYFMLGGGLISGAPDGVNKQTGAEFLGGFGAEFFIPGLESLGFAFETGGEFDNLSGSFALKTLGVNFLNAGIHFYF